MQGDKLSEWNAARSRAQRHRSDAVGAPHRAKSGKRSAADGAPSCNAIMQVSAARLGAVRNERFLRGESDAGANGALK
jgi:hypothetical protein